MSQQAKRSNMQTCSQICYITDTLKTRTDCFTSGTLCPSHKGGPKAHVERKACFQLAAVRHSLQNVLLQDFFEKVHATTELQVFKAIKIFLCALPLCIRQVFSRKRTHKLHFWKHAQESRITGLQFLVVFYHSARTHF